VPEAEGIELRRLKFRNATVGLISLRRLRHVDDR